MRALADDMGADFVVGADDKETEDLAAGFADIIVPVKSGGFLEGAINSTIAASTGGWILQLDSDEFPSPALRQFLIEKDWAIGNLKCISFPFAWLYGDDKHMIVDMPLCGDFHPRLMWREIANRAEEPHAVPGNMYGAVAPFLMLHYKLLYRSYDERKKIAEFRETLGDNMGLGYRTVYSIPEDYYLKINTGYIGDGRLPIPIKEPENV